MKKLLALTIVALLGLGLTSTSYAQPPQPAGSVAVTAPAAKADKADCDKTNKADCTKADKADCDKTKAASGKVKYNKTAVAAKANKADYDKTKSKKATYTKAKSEKEKEDCATKCSKGK